MKNKCDCLYGFYHRRDKEDLFLVQGVEGSEFVYIGSVPELFPQFPKDKIMVVRFTYCPFCGKTLNQKKDIKYSNSFLKNYAT